MTGYNIATVSMWGKKRDGQFKQMFPTWVPLLLDALDQCGGVMQPKEGAPIRARRTNNDPWHPERPVPKKNAGKPVKGKPWGSGSNRTPLIKNKGNPKGNPGVRGPNTGRGHDRRVWKPGDPLP